MATTTWYRKFLDLRLRWHSLECTLPETIGESGAQELAYFDSGSPRSKRNPGAPILLLHGFTADKESWLGLARRLGKNHRLIAPDLAGHGQSSKATDAADGEYGIARQAERAHDLVEKLDSDLEPYHVLGHSMGGAVAIKYAVDFPERVRSLGLISPAAAMDPHTEEFHEHRRGEARPPLQINPLIVSKGKKGIEWSASDRIRYVTNGPRWFHRVSRLLDSYLTELGLDDQDLNTTIFKELTKNNPPIADDEFKRIRQPTFILWGKDDRVLTPDPCYITSRMAPEVGVRVEQWGGVGHSPNIEKPRKTAEAYLAFLEGVRNQVGRTAQ